MANTQKTIEILFVGVDKVSNITSAIADDMGQLNNSIASVSQPFADLAGGILKADAALAALAAGGLALAFNESKKFESATISLDKIMSDLPEQVEAARKEALLLSTEYGQSAVSILDSTTAFKKAGFDIEEAMTLAKDSMDLVIAGELEASLASEILISTLKGFGAEASEAGRLVGILNGVSNNYATNVEQLGIGMSKLSPIARQMGFSFEETAGLLTPVIEVFRSGDEAAVAYRTGLLKLLDDSKPVADALLNIGVSQTDVNGQMRSGRDIYYDVAEAFKTLDDNQKLVIASQLVGIRQAAKLVIGFDGIAQTIEVTNVALASHDSALIEVEKRLASAEIAVGRFKVGFQNLGIVIGDQFLEASKDAIEGGIAIENALTSAIDAGKLDPLFDALRSAFTDLGEDLVDIANAIPEAFSNLEFEDFLSSMGSLTDEIQNTFDQFDITTPEGLTDFLQFMIDGISSLVNVTAGMVSSAEPFVDMLFDIVDGFNQAGEETQQAAGDFTGFMAIINQLTGPIGTLINGLGGIGSGLQLIGSAQLITAIGGPAGIAGAFTRFGASIVSFLPTLLSLAPQLAIVAAAIGIVGVGISTAIDEYNGWQAAEEDLQKSLDRGIEARDKLAEKYEKISDQTGIVITSSQDLHAEIEKGTIALNKQTGEWEAIDNSLAKFTDQVSKANDANLEWSESNRGLVDEFGNFYGVVDKATAKIRLNEDAAIDVAAAYFELQGNTPAVARALAEMGVSADGATESLKEVEEQTQATTDKILELASDERIKAMEFTASIEIAGIEASTAKIEAAFGSIDNTISALTSNIGSLFSTLGEAEDFSTKWALEDQIERENDLRDQALKDQHELIQAQIESQRIKNENARDGGGGINISMDGIYPELEMIMWEIVKRVRIQVIESESDFLTVAP